MPLSPDLATSGALALVVFLVVLGVLVVFVESVTSFRLAGVLLACVAAAFALVLLGEWGLALVPLAFGAAFVANQAFEWLTTR